MHLVCYLYVCTQIEGLNNDHVRYLFEIGESSECLRLANITLKAVNEGTLLHARLQNSLFGLYFSQNDLRQARPCLEGALRVMREHLGDRSEEYIGMTSNFGNLLAAEGRNEAAIVQFLQAESLRTQLNYPQNMGLAFLQLGVGRAELQRGNIVEAERRFKAAEDIVQKVHGDRGLYMQEYVTPKPSGWNFLADSPL